MRSFIKLLALLALVTPTLAHAQDYVPPNQVATSRFVNMGDGTYALRGVAVTQNIPGEVELEVSSANAAAANNQTLANAAAKMTYITGFTITGGGATGASIITVTVTGLTNTLTYFVPIPAGAGVSITPLYVFFARPIPASAVNTAIVVNVPSFGAGNTAAAANAYGFQR